MARFTKDQAKEFAENQAKQSSVIYEAIKNEDWARLHGEKRSSDPIDNRAFNQFLNYCKSRLHEEVFNKYRELIKFPLPSVRLVDRIYTELSKALGADDKTFRYHFSDPELEEEFIEELDEKGLGLSFGSEVLQLMRVQHQSIMVFDLPEDGSDPYYYFLDIRNVRNILTSREGIEALAYNMDEEFTVVVDEESWFIFKRDGQDLLYEREEVHGLGEVPAEFISKGTPLKENYIVRDNFTFSDFQSLDDFNFWHFAIEYYETYGAFPIHWMYAIDCNYVDKEGNQCNDGVVHIYAGNDEVSKYACPQCEKNRRLGNGTVLTVDPPRGGEAADMRLPAGIISMDVNAVKLLNEKQDDREKAIMFSTTGEGGEPETLQPRNEKDVQSGFEGKQAVLDRVKENVEHIHKWAIEIYARLRYGKSFKGSVVSYGTRYYFKSYAELVEQYKVSKDTGLPNYHLRLEREELYNTKFKHNPDMKLRSSMLEALEPMADHNNTEYMTNIKIMREIGLPIDPIQVTIKTYFNDFVARFERENTPVERFGELLDLDKRIDIIYKQLTTYADERIRESAETEGRYGTKPEEPTGGDGKKVQR